MAEPISFLLAGFGLVVPIIQSGYYVYNTHRQLKVMGEEYGIKMREIDAQYILTIGMMKRRRDDMETPPSDAQIKGAILETVQNLENRFERCQQVMKKYDQNYTVSSRPPSFLPLFKISYVGLLPIAERLAVCLLQSVIRKSFSKS
jgi:hypothetical protein